MRKRYKSKRRSCGLCKPHKRGWLTRWNTKVADQITRAEAEIVNAAVPIRAALAEERRKSQPDEPFESEA